MRLQKQKNDSLAISVSRYS